MWDENWDVIHLFEMYSEQWRMGFNGPIGLDMTVFHHELDRKGIPADEYDTWIHQLRIIQAEALHRMKYYT